MSATQARALEPEFDPVLSLIEAGEFTEAECESGTYGLCAMFAFALYRCVQSFDPVLVFVCSERNGSPRCKSDNGLRWRHAAVKVGDAYYDIEGLQRPEWLINNYVTGELNSYGVIVEVTLDEFLKEVMMERTARDWRFLVKCKNRLLS